MNWIGRLFLAFFLIAAVSGLANANAHADTFPKPIAFPRATTVANVLGNRLAADPRVAYPPTVVNCWYPETDLFSFKCDAWHQTNTKHWRVRKDDLYGVHVKLYEDGSFTIRYIQIASWSDTVRKF